MASASYNPKTGIMTYTIEYDPNKPHWKVVNNVELTDECIAKIADAVVRKLEDRKTENSSEKPNNCDEPTWEQVKEYCNKRCLDIVDSAMRKQWYKDEPYIDIETGILHWCGWKYRRIYEDEPQRDCFLCKWLGDVDVCGRCRNRNLFAEADPEPKPKTEPTEREGK